MTFKIADGESGASVRAKLNTSPFYTPAGAGAVERSVAAKLGESVSLADFGAVGDGADTGSGGATGTDDTAAITAAIAAAAARGVPVDGDGKTYRHNSAINLPASGKTWLQNCTIITGAFIGEIFVGSDSASMELFGLKDFTYIDPRALGSELAQWATIVFSFNHPSQNSYPPLSFFMEDCEIIGGGINGIRYTIPTAETNTNRSFSLRRTTFRGRIRDDQDQVAVNVGGNNEPSTVLTYIEEDVNVYNYRKGLRIRSTTNPRVIGGLVSGCPDVSQVFFGKDTDSLDPDTPNSVFVMNKRFDAASNPIAATAGEYQGLLVFGLYSGPITAIANHLYGDRTNTLIGISADTVRGDDSADEGERVVSSRDVIVGNVIRTAQTGIAQNNHREWHYANNTITECDVGIRLQQSEAPSKLNGLTVNNVITDCTAGIRYNTLFAGTGERYRQSADNSLVSSNVFNNCTTEVDSGPDDTFGGDGPGYEGLVAQHQAERRISSATWIHNHGTPHIVVASASAGMVVRLPFARRQRVGQRMTLFNESTDTYALKPARLLFDDTDVDTANDLVALPADSLLYTGAQRDFATGDRVVLASAGTLPAGLTQGAVYYIVHNPRGLTLSTGTSTGQEEIGFATSYANAIAGTLVPITSVTGGQTGHIVGDGYWDDTGTLQTAETDTDVIATTELLVELVSVPGGWQRIRNAAPAPTETTIDASSGDTTSDLVASMEFGKTYEVKLEETTALDGDANTSFSLGDGTTADVFLAAVTATGSAVGYAVVNGTENVGLPLRVTVTNNASATAGEVTATVIVK